MSLMLLKTLLKWLNQRIFCSLAPLSPPSGCLKTSTTAATSLTPPYNQSDNIMKVKKVFMVGVGGIGMSALAQLYAAHGIRVSGSDREESPATKMLAQKGVAVFIGQKAEQVPPDVDLLVYSDAVPADNPERTRGKELKIPELSYFEALGKAVESKRVVAVAGTHGKKTTNALPGKNFIYGGVDPTGT